MVSFVTPTGAYIVDSSIYAKLVDSLLAKKESWVLIDDVEVSIATHSTVSHSVLKRVNGSLVESLVSRDVYVLAYTSKSASNIDLSLGCT